MRQVVQDEGDEDIIGIVALAPELAADNAFSASRANCFALFDARLTAAANAAVAAASIAGVPGLQPVFQLLARSARGSS